MSDRSALSSLTSRGSRRRPGRFAAGVAVLLVGLVAAACGSDSAGSSTSTTVKATPAVQLFNAGLTAQTENNPAQAVSDFTASLALDSSSVYAEYDLGIAQTSLGHTSAAVAAYRKAIALGPTFKPAFFNLADLLTPSEPATAIKLFKQLEKIDPKDANVEFNLGLLLEVHGQLAAGEAQLKAALIANPVLKSRVPKGTQLARGTP